MPLKEMAGLMSDTWPIRPKPRPRCAVVLPLRARAPRGRAQAMPGAREPDRYCRFLGLIQSLLSTKSGLVALWGVRHTPAVVSRPASGHFRRFMRSSSPSRHDGLPPGMIAPVVLVVIAVLLVWFGTLDARHLLRPDEGRYAEISREMFATGDWVTIRYNALK